ncbi:ABC transporter substrate-binding protein [Dactylosporangium sp. NPDC049140]|uniref:ABC transporter substrate-binding protein n=1 Tax=Dactylosporangium sp. NPDC049140 TaxID=3155647 RepID=UPI0033ED3BEB
MSSVSSTAKRSVRGVALTAVVALALAGCGGEKIGGGAAAASGSAKPCGTVNLAMNAWVGYTANGAVLGQVLKDRLGCTVVEKNIDEQVSWQGFGTGEVDVIMENWGHEDLAKKYITEQKVAVDFGPTKNTGYIGWYVPPWLAKQYPDITKWENLNKYAELFKTSESGGKGQILDGDPSFVTNDAALVTNLKLNYKVVYAGSETALIQAFRQAEAQKKPVIGYFYEPQWFFSELKLVRVELPPYTAGCDADPQKVACGYPPYTLNKVVSKKFADSGSPAVAVVKNFNWTNDDQNLVAQDISVNNLTPQAAAKKWIDANPDKVKAWLG